MAIFLRDLLLLAVALAVVYCVGCSSGAEQRNESELRKTEIISVSSDAEWDFAPLASLTSDGSQRRIRCNGDAICWVWNRHSIWIGESRDRWREFYTTASQRNTDGEIRSVHLNPSQDCWIVIGDALYLKENGSESLRRISVGATNEDSEVALWSVYFVDKDHGWVAGAKLEPLRKDDPRINTEVTRGLIRVACIYETSDGGLTWKPQNLPRLIGSFEEIDFWENKLGLAFSRNNVVFTNDGGRSWVDATKYVPPKSDRGEPAPTRFVNGFFLEPEKGWLVFTQFDFESLVTKNGGNSWETTTWEINSESQDTASYPPRSSFAFVDAMHGLFVYNHTEGGELFKTSDAGRTWRQFATNGPRDEVFFDLFFRKGTGGRLVTNKGVYKFSLK